ncbi:MAG: hypothetical protein ACE5EK_03005 [Nitrospinales bacterium]
MGDYMPRLKDIYEAYQVAKMQTRRKSDIYGGCRYCEKGKVYYERQNPLSRNKSWVSYIGWCGHCNPPINKNGMFCMLSDCEYPNIRFLTKPSRIDSEQPPKMVKQVVQDVIGKADPEKEKLREKNLAKNQERGQELPF